MGLHRAEVGGPGLRPDIEASGSLSRVVYMSPTTLGL